MKIMYRGKDIAKKIQWLYGLYYKDARTNEAILVSETTGEHKKIIFTTLGIFTNKVTETGKEIYTGDVILVKDYASFYNIFIPRDFLTQEIMIKNKIYLVEQKCKVIFHEGAFGIYVKKETMLYYPDMFYSLTEIEQISEMSKFGGIIVAGNVTDNPEILSEKEENK